MNSGLKFVLGCAIFFAVWIISFLIPQITENEALFIILKGFPGYILISFGCYSLFQIGSSLFILKDYPTEHLSLLEDISRSKHFFKAKNVNVI